MDRREEIYKKALDLFIERGYDDTPMSLVAKALNLSKAGLYHYFKSKEHMLFLIHRHYLEKYLIPIIEKAEAVSEPEKRIIYFMDNYIKLLTSDAAVRVLIHEIRKLGSKHQQKIREIWKRAYDLTRSAITEMSSSGKGKALPSAFSAFAVIGMCSWIFYWFDYKRPDSVSDLSETFIEIFFRGILK